MSGQGNNCHTEVAQRHGIYQGAALESQGGASKGHAKVLVDVRSHILHRLPRIYVHVLRGAVRHFDRDRNVRHLASAAGKGARRGHCGTGAMDLCYRAHGTGAQVRTGLRDQGDRIKAGARPEHSHIPSRARGRAVRTSCRPCSRIDASSGTASCMFCTRHKTIAAQGESRSRSGTGNKIAHVAAPTGKLGGARPVGTSTILDFPAKGEITRSKNKIWLLNWCWHAVARRTTQVGSPECRWHAGVVLAGGRSRRV